MFKFIKNIKFLSFIVFILIIIPESIVMATMREMQTIWPATPGGFYLTVNSTITDLIRYIYEWGIALGGLVAFIALLIAGFAYMTSVGDPTKMKEAIDRIKSALLGLILLLSSWLILNTINPDLTTLREIPFNPDEIEQPEPINLEELTEKQPCEFGIAFPAINFEETSDDDPVKIGTKDTYGNLGFHTQSIIVCRRIKCREVRCRTIKEGETRNDLCPENQTLVDGEQALLGKSGCSDDQVPELDIADRTDKDRLCVEYGGRDYYVEGGSCMLQLFDGSPFWVGCGGPEFNVIGTNSNINRLFDTQAIECIRLLKIKEI